MCRCPAGEDSMSNTDSESRVPAEARDVGGAGLRQAGAGVAQGRGRVTEVKHPLVQHKLSYLRDKDTPTVHFRKLVNELTLLLTYEATKDFPTEPVEIETPLEKMEAQRISGKKVAVNPMLATGNSSAAAVSSVKAAGARSVTLVCLVAAPVGIARVHEEHPDVHIVCAAIDRELNDKGYIVPGLGDAGDRLYGTK